MALLFVMRVIALMNLVLTPLPLINLLFRHFIIFLRPMTLMAVLLLRVKTGLVYLMVIIVWVPGNGQRK